jgi:hypothetical protein
VLLTALVAMQKPTGKRLRLSVGAAQSPEYTFSKFSNNCSVRSTALFIKKGPGDGEPGPPAATHWALGVHKCRRIVRPASLALDIVRLSAFFSATFSAP